ncbi:glycoside hydrolase family 32 protein [bacterium D16-51]|nr:glycoside hydrolase family 32 protein [bacterium D16-59]RKI57052.1 glycoside hydrolase family 32 protein [bacterium D16-51]
MADLERANKYQEENRIEKSKKPVFHVAPPVGWMNDPNGFSIFQGKVHLFYQYHPYSDAWGPMHWGHYVSEDFVEWKELPAALAPDTGYDAAGCFSGSAIGAEEGHMLIYTGVMEKEGADGKKEMVQQQCLAVGDGICYKKVPENPVIPAERLPEGFSRKDFRDPKVWRENETYYLAAGNKNAQQDGQVVLFESKDLRAWRYLSVLADNQGKYGKMWECPDFFSLGQKYVLLVSPQDMQADGKEFHNGNQAIALIGEYDRQNYHLQEEQVVSLDYGTDFYAPQTLETEDGRRIMVAWMQSWDMNIKPEEQKWNGMMTVPRQLELRNNILYQRPVKELEHYYTEEVVYIDREISGSCQLPGVQGRVLDLSIELKEGSYQEFAVFFAQNEKYHISFRYVRAAQSIEFDRTYSGMVRDAVCQRSMRIKKTEGNLKLRFLLDRFSVELFVNDGMQTFTSTFYTPLDAEDIVFVCDGKVKLNIKKYTIAMDKEL